ncbi:GntR family transcriptional regulator [Cohnella fermenti]|uniref:GntR family transcriptional regulator n=1 Tax=Cohnella fermenti TaxID=2565925 RepID=A0A4S4BN24_9BACL|nr:GntR family transcriptional regulator [Cohnella fermenti]
MIDKQSVVPLYYQLKEYLKREIESGHYQVDELIPSERELSERFEINRMTVRQAINELVQEGMLQRQRGVGTFVSKRKIEQPLTRLSNFTSDMVNRGMKPGARFLSMDVIPATASIAQKLQIQEGVNVIELIRIRTGDGEPMALEKCYLVYEWTSSLVGINMEDQSLYKVLEEKCGLKLTRAVQTIEITYVTPSEAHFLEVAGNDAVMLIERITYEENKETPVEYVKSLYRGDRYKFSIEMNI